MNRTRILVAAALLFTATAALAQTNPVWPYPGQTAGPVAPLDTPLLSTSQPQYVNSLPIPVDFTPDKTTYPGWDYYEIQMAPANPVAYWAKPPAVGTQPDGTEWLGLVDPVTLAPLYTPVWGYGQVNMGGGPLGGKVTYPAMNIRGAKGTPIKVKWINNAPDQHLFCQQPTNYNWPCAIDRTLMGTKVGAGVTAFGGSQQADNAMVIHFHGGEIPPNSDGFAELWFGNVNSAKAYTPVDPVTGLPIPQAIDPPLSVAGGASLNLVRPIGNSMLYNYPMVNDASTLWYHDHALGKTRINVAAGPAGFFPISDPANEPIGLPSGKYEINVALQDRDFNAPQPGSNLATINYPNGLNWAQVAPVAFQTPLTPGGNPTVHPQWVPEYFGTFPIVNGMAWPFLNVEPRKYRLHLLAGSNARCWNLSRSDAVPMTVIGDDQGYLSAPVSVVKLLMCPGERYDVIIDFTGLKVGTKVYLANNAPAPFPKGVAPSKGDVGKPMAFKVVALAAPDTSVVPATLVPVTPLPTVGVNTREMVLNEVLDAVTLYPLRVQIDGKAFEADITETPAKGATEVWKIINTTGDAHPMHLHLVKFQIVNRQNFDQAKYSAATGFAVPGNTTFTKLPIAPYLNGAPRPPAPYEAGWKDTAVSYPGEVLTIVANWDGKWNTALADPGIQGDPLNQPTLPQPAFLQVTSGPYVWHCHIVDHEDNEMMRPVMVQ